MAVKGKFAYGNSSVPMEIGWVFACGKLEDLGYDILSILSDGGATMQKILLDDRSLLKIWYHFVHEHTNDDWDTAIETLDQTNNGLENFREEFYKLVVSFSPPQAREILGEMWKKAKRDMKDSRRLKSMLSSSDSLDELESSQTDIPSEN